VIRMRAGSATFTIDLCRLPVSIFFKRKVFVHTAIGVRKNTRIRNDAGPMIREGGYCGRVVIFSFFRVLWL